jgi:hypothetical protein
MSGATRARLATSGFYSVDQWNRKCDRDPDLSFNQAIRFAREQILQLPERERALLRPTALRSGIGPIEKRVAIGILHDRNPLKCSMGLMAHGLYTNTG